MLIGPAASAVLFASSLAVTPAQERPPLEFRADVRMIRLDVSVVDAKGRPIPGLGAADFQVTEDGRPMEVTLFEAIEDGLPAELRARAASDAAGLEGGIAVGQGADPGVVVVPRPRAAQRILLLVDTANMTFGQLTRARDGAARFIAESAQHGDWVRLMNLATGEAWDGSIPDERLALARIARGLLPMASPWSGSPAPEGIVQVSDRGAISVSGQGFDSVTAGRSLSIFAQAAGLLGTLESLLVQLDGVEGRKALVLVSPGFPQLLDLDQRLQKVATLARLAATTIYFVDAAGLDGLLPEPGGRMLPAFELAWSRSGGAMDLAQATGGFTSRFSNTLLPALERVGHEMRSYYVVGYAPVKPDDGRFRSVKVKVNAKGASARTKKGYLAGARRRRP
jgi:VWFA-related protein